MHKNAFTYDNAAIVAIDHQVGTMGWTQSRDIDLAKKNALKLAKIAKVLDMPVFVAGITTEIRDTFPVLQMLEEGYAVPVSVDACTSWSQSGR
jgi:hypothetical protein